jgi:hypothetical protein
MSTITAEVSEGTKKPNGSGMPERLGLKILIISGFREGDARYGVLYLTDPYEGFFQKIMKTDGFDTVIFIINEASTAGVIAWNSSVKGWVKGNGDLENDLRAAEITDFEPWVELLVGGIANREIANEHPDWRQKDQNGRFIEYMGEQMCMNSPYWNQYLLPLYGELFQKFGKK